MSFKSRRRKMLLFYVGSTSSLAILLYWLFAVSQAVGSDGERGYFLTLGSLSLFFGFRHALDADHLAAIDNAVRKLTQEGKDPMFAGTFFSLGHSTVVLILSSFLMVASKEVERDIPQLQSVGSVVGTLISGGVLYILGILNLFVALEIYALFRRAKEGEIQDEEANKVLLRRGFMARFLGGAFEIVKSQYSLYPIGFLFGLGFDTATETALLAISASSATLFSSQEVYTLLVFPLLFMVGMTVVDSTDGFFMSSAYSWAFNGDVLRKIWYNLSMTLISILVAFLVGSLEILGLVTGEMGITGWPWSALEVLNGEYWSVVGLVIVGVFALSWTVSYMFYRYRVAR